jgi:hypothetical protein
MISFGTLLADQRKGDLYSVLRKWQNNHGGCLRDYLEVLYHIFTEEMTTSEAAREDIRKLLDDDEDGELEKKQ